MEYIFLSVLLIVIQFLLTQWVKSRLENSIRHEYEKLLENYKHNLAKNEQAAKIAALFALWITPDSEDTKRETVLELNKLTFELALWIPDEKLVIEVMKKLNHTKDSQDIKQILLSCREMIQGAKSQDLKAGAIIHFPYNPK